jgi:hypothetical protein
MQFVSGEGSVSTNGRIGVYWQIRPGLGPQENGAIHTMECPVCIALNREHGRECEIEATAILKERSGWISTYRSESSGPDVSIHEVVLTSRKRQMQIASELERHRAADHVA